MVLHAASQGKAEGGILVLPPGVLDAAELDKVGEIPPAAREKADRGRLVLAG